MVIPSTKMREHPMNCMQEGRSIVPFPKILSVTGISFSPILRRRFLSDTSI